MLVEKKILIWVAVLLVYQADKKSVQRVDHLVALTMTWVGYLVVRRDVEVVAELVTCRADWKAVQRVLRKDIHLVVMTVTYLVFHWDG